jgi:hypothetical protein
VKAAGFFVGKFRKMHVFWDSDVPFWMAVGGVFVDVGQAGRGGEGFFATEMQISMIFGGSWGEISDVRNQMSARKVPHLIFADFPPADI